MAHPLRASSRHAGTRMPARTGFGKLDLNPLKIPFISRKSLDWKWAQKYWMSNRQLALVTAQIHALLCAAARFAKAAREPGQARNRLCPRSCGPLLDILSNGRCRRHAAEHRAFARDWVTGTAGSLAPWKIHTGEWPRASATETYGSTVEWRLAGESVCTPPQITTRAANLPGLAAAKAQASYPPMEMPVK